MKKTSLFALALLALLNVAAIFETYTYLEPAQFKAWLESGKQMVIVDIQEKPAFAAHHFRGSIETNAYPVDTEEQRKQLNPAVAAAKQSGQEVVIVCPRGGGGAKKTFSYMKSQGIAEGKLFILTGGEEKWPYREILQDSK